MDYTLAEKENDKFI